MVNNADKYCLYTYSGGSFTVIAKVGKGLSSVKLLSNLYADGIREIITDKKTPTKYKDVKNCKCSFNVIQFT